MQCISPTFCTESVYHYNSFLTMQLRGPTFPANLFYVDVLIEKLTFHNDDFISFWLKQNQSWIPDKVMYYELLIICWGGLSNHYLIWNYMWLGLTQNSIKSTNCSEIVLSFIFFLFSFFRKCSCVMLLFFWSNLWQADKIAVL